MITGPGGGQARCVRCDALPPASHGDAEDRAAGAVDGAGDRDWLGRRRSRRTGELAGGMLGRSGAQA